jgi:hypothetical protein
MCSACVSLVRLVTVTTLAQCAMLHVHKAVLAHCLFGGVLDGVFLCNTLQQHEGVLAFTLHIHPGYALWLVSAQAGVRSSQL